MTVLFNPTIEVVTFRLRGWCILSVFCLFCFFLGGGVGFVCLFCFVVVGVILLFCCWWWFVCLVFYFFIFIFYFFIYFFFFWLPAFTRLGHERQDLLSSSDGMRM